MTYVTIKEEIFQKIFMKDERKTMVKINDPKIMNKFIEKYNILESFSMDIRPYMELMLFKKGEHICRDGEDINYLMFFVEGKAKVYLSLHNGKSLLLCFYHSLTMLGDVEVFNRQPASSNIQVIQDSYCIAISMQNVQAYLLSDAKFLCFLGRSLGNKLNRCGKNSSINLLYPLENRLASYILATGQLKDYDGRKVIEFNENLTEISELLGTSYRHLLRTLNILVSKGAIKKNGNCYEVFSEAILKKMAADLYK